LSKISQWIEKRTGSYWHKKIGYKKSSNFNNFIVNKIANKNKDLKD
jgi:hypothetical protein